MLALPALQKEVEGDMLIVTSCIEAHTHQLGVDFS